MNALLRWQPAGRRGSEEIRPGWHFAGRRLTVVIPAALGYDILRLNSISRTLAQHLPRHHLAFFLNWTKYAVKLKKCLSANLTCWRKLSTWAKISRRRGHLPPTILHVQKTRMIDLSYDVRMWAEDYFVLSECTRFTDRRTNRQISTEVTWSNRVRCTLKTGQLLPLIACCVKMIRLVWVKSLWRGAPTASPADCSGRRRTSCSDKNVNDVKKLWWANKMYLEPIQKLCTKLWEKPEYWRTLWMSNLNVLSKVSTLFD